MFAGTVDGGGAEVVGVRVTGVPSSVNSAAAVAIAPMATNAPSAGRCDSAVVNDGDLIGNLREKILGI